jgi:hypothetical protein
MKHHSNLKQPKAMTRVLQAPETIFAGILVSGAAFPLKAL